MINIIGTDSKYIKNCSCRNCATRLQYVQADMQSETYRDYGGGSDIRYWIVCPKCNNEIVVSR